MIKNRRNKYNTDNNVITSIDKDYPNPHTLDLYQYQNIFKSLKMKHKHLPAIAGHLYVIVC